MLTFDDLEVHLIFRSLRADNVMSDPIIAKSIESEAASTKCAKMHWLPVVDIHVYR